MSKTYPSWLKALAIALTFAVPLFLLSMIPSFAGIYDDLQYASFYDWEITDGRAEEISDNLYRVTLTLKNHSAYRKKIYDYDIQVTCNNKRVDKIGSALHDSSLLDGLKNPILPAGQTTEYSFDIVLPPDAEFISLEYSGASSSRRIYLNMEGSWQRSYTLDL